jgi:hypothetical protein
VVDRLETPEERDQPALLEQAEQVVLIPVAVVEVVVKLHH